MAWRLDALRSSKRRQQLATDVGRIQPTRGLVRGAVAYEAGAGIAALGIAAARTLIRRDERDDVPGLEPALDPVA